MARRLASIPQTAENFGIHPRTVRRMIASGDLKAYRVGSGRLIRIDLDEAESLLKPIPTAEAR